MGRVRIEELDLDVRTWNCLRKAGINYVDTLALNTPDQLRQIRNFGRKCLLRVKDRLAERGLKLADPADEITIEGHGPTDTVAFLPVEEREVREAIRALGCRMLDLTRALTHSPSVYTDRRYLVDAKEQLQELRSLANEALKRLRSEDGRQH